MKNIYGKSKNIFKVSLVTKLILTTVMLISGQVLAQAPADENFDDDTLFDITSNNFDNDGVNYQIVGTTTYRTATYNSAFNLSEGGATDYALQFDKNAAGGISSITISASDGSAFELAGMSMDFLSDTDIQFTSNNGGNFTLSPNDGLYVLYQNYDFTLQPGFDNITSFTISGTNMVGDIDDLNFEPVFDTNGDLAAAGGVTEPVALPSTVTSTAGAVDVFDFTISDGGGDGFTLDVTTIDVLVSGTSSDAERGQVTWRLSGPDALNVTGIYDAGTDKITFSGLSISIPESGSEIYTINTYYNDNTNLTEDHTFVLTIDGDTDLTLVNDGLKTQMGATSAVNNGTGTPIDITATQLTFTTQPAGSISGAALTTQPVVTSRDAAGNTDVDFTETITLTEASAGTLTNNTQAATNGVSTFTNLIYTATADQESFTLTANDQDGVGTDLPTVDANVVTSDVVATKLVFNTQPAPTSFKADGTSTSFTTVPVVAAKDANDVVDTGYSTGIILAEVNGTGSATLTDAGGDTDGSASTVTITPVSGASTFTGLEIDYTLNDVNTDENFNLQATSGGLTSANSTQLTAVGNAAPAVASLPSDITVLEETQSDVDLSGTIFSDADGDELIITLEASSGSFGTPADGSGVGAGVTETLVNSTTITLAGAAVDINTYLSTASNITYTGDTNVSGEDAADITVHANDGQINPSLGTINLDITDINDAPALSATGQNPTFTEGDAAPGADLYSGVTASTVEAVQRFAGLSLIVTNLSDGAFEILRFDGSDIALTNGNSATTATNGLTAEVSVSVSTATVSFTGASLTEAQMQTLVDELAYRNTSDNPTTGSNRVVTITSVSDNGGTANGGVDTSAPNLQSTVSLTAVNDAPTLSATGADPTYTDGDDPVALFTGANTSAVEAGQTFTQLTLTVDNLADGADEKLTIDGTEVDLIDDNNVTTAAGNLSVNVLVATGTATVSVSGAEIASATMNTLIDSLAYRNASYTPSTGTNRVVTLTGLTDDGGTANGGVNTGAYGISSSVSVADLVRPAPVLASSSPVDGAVDVDPNASVIATFDKDITATDLSGVSITDGGGTPVGGVSASLSGTNELTFASNTLVINVTYTVTIPGGTVANVDGVANGEITWSFTTVSEGPQLIFSDPANGATGVATDSPIELIFDQTLYPGDLSSISLIGENNEQVSGLHANISGTVLYITHSGLNEATTYTLTLPEATVRNSGLVASDLLELNFTTTLGTPEIVVTTPADGATATDPQAPLTIDFNYAVALTDSADITLTDTTGQLVSVTVSTDSSRMTITHDGLVMGTVYQVHMSAGSVINAEDYPNETYSFSFTTRLTAPAILGFSPEDGATMVATTTPIEVHWSQPVEVIDSAAIGLYYEATSTNPVAVHSITTSEDILHITPAGLANGREVEVRIGAGALANADGVENAAFSWRFTTIVATPGAPKLTSPEDGSSTDTTLTITWGPTGDTESYHVQVADDSIFESVRNEQEDLADTSFTLAGLDYAAIYFWRVRAENASGYGPWSETFRFTTNPNEGIQLSSPLGNLELDEDFDNLTVADLDTIFTNLGTGTLSYSVSVDTNLVYAGVEASKLLLAPLADAYGQVRVTITADDGRGNLLADTLMLAITPVNDAPRLAFKADTTYEFEESKFTMSYKGLIWDPESSLEVLAISITTSEQQVTAQVDIAEGILAFASGGYVGLVEAVITVTDPEGASGEVVIHVEFLSPVSSETERDIPADYSLAQNYPNPFNPATTITYALPEPGKVRLEVFNLLGRRVAVLAEGTKPAGRHIVHFDASTLSSGVYLYRLQVGGKVFTHKLTLIK